MQGRGSDYNEIRRRSSLLIPELQNSEKLVSEIIRLDKETDDMLIENDIYERFLTITDEADEKTSLKARNAFNKVCQMYQDYSVSGCKISYAQKCIMAGDIRDELMQQIDDLTLEQSNHKDMAAMHLQNYAEKEKALCAALKEFNMLFKEEAELNNGVVALEKITHYIDQNLRRLTGYLNGLSLANDVLQQNVSQLRVKLRKILDADSQPEPIDVEKQTLLLHKNRSEFIIIQRQIQVTKLEFTFLFRQFQSYTRELNQQQKLKGKLGQELVVRKNIVQKLVNRYKQDKTVTEQLKISAANMRDQVSNLQVPSIGSYVKVIHQHRDTSHKLDNAERRKAITKAIYETHKQLWLRAQRTQK